MYGISRVNYRSNNWPKGKPEYFSNVYPFWVKYTAITASLKYEFIYWFKTLPDFQLFINVRMYGSNAEWFISTGNFVYHADTWTAYRYNDGPWSNLVYEYVQAKSWGYGNAISTVVEANFQTYDLFTHAALPISIEKFQFYNWVPGSAEYFDSTWK